MMPPTTQSAIISSGLGTFWAIPAGDRKMPEPIVMPITSATELQSPSRRGKPPFVMCRAGLQFVVCRSGLQFVMCRAGLLGPPESLTHGMDPEDLALQKEHT